MSTSLGDLEVLAHRSTRLSVMSAVGTGCVALTASFSARTHPLSALLLGFAGLGLLLSARALLAQARLLRAVGSASFAWMRPAAGLVGITGVLALGATIAFTAGFRTPS